MKKRRWSDCISFGRAERMQIEHCLLVQVTVTVRTESSSSRVTGTIPCLRSVSPLVPTPKRSTHKESDDLEVKLAEVLKCSLNHYVNQSLYVFIKSS